MASKHTWYLIYVFPNVRHLWKMHWKIYKKKEEEEEVGRE